MKIFRSSLSLFLLTWAAVTCLFGAQITFDPAFPPHAVLPADPTSDALDFVVTGTLIRDDPSNSFAIKAGEVSGVVQELPGGKWHATFHFDVVPKPLDLTATLTRISPGVPDSTLTTAVLPDIAFGTVWILIGPRDLLVAKARTSATPSTRPARVFQGDAVGTATWLPAELGDTVPQRLAQALAARLASRLPAVREQHAVGLVVCPISEFIWSESAVARYKIAPESRFDAASAQIGNWLGAAAPSIRTQRLAGALWFVGRGDAAQQSWNPYTDSDQHPLNSTKLATVVDGFSSQVVEDLKRWNAQNPDIRTRHVLCAPWIPIPADVLGRFGAQLTQTALLQAAEKGGPSLIHVVVPAEEERLPFVVPADDPAIAAALEALLAHVAAQAWQ